MTLCVAVVGGAGCGDEDDDSGASFCSLLQRSDEIILGGATEPANPADVEATLLAGRSTFGEMMVVAPAEMAPDVQMVHDAFAEYVEAFASVGYDVAALEANPDALARSEAFTSDEVRSAKANLAAYAEGECGITLGG